MWNLHHSFMAKVTISLTFNCDRVNHKNASEISSQIHRRGETWPPPHLGEHPCYCQSKNPVTVKTITFSEPVWKKSLQDFSAILKSHYSWCLSIFFSLSSLNSSDFSPAFFLFFSFFLFFFFILLLKKTNWENLGEWQAAAQKMQAEQGLKLWLYIHWEIE